MNRILLIIFILASINLKAQTDFPALKQQFLDYRKADKQDSALFIARKMNQLAIKEQSDTSYWYGLSLRYQGNVLFKQEIFDSVHFYWTKSLTFFELNRPNTEDHASSLNNMGLFLVAVGNYSKAKDFYLKAAEIRKTFFGPESHEFLITINNLAISQLRLFDFRYAESLFKESLEARGKKSGENNIDYAVSLNNLAGLYHEIGDYTKAEYYYLKSLEIKARLVGENNMDYALTLNNLGTLYSDIGQYSLADSMLVKTLNLKKQLSGDITVNYSMTLNNLGNLNMNIRNFSQSLYYHKECAEIRRKKLGVEHPLYAESLNNMGILFLRMKNYNLADSFLRVSSEIKKSVYNEYHPDYVSTMTEYAFALSKTFREFDAYFILRTNFLKKSKQIADNFEWLNESQKEAYWKKESEFFDQLSWFANEAYEKVPEAVGLNYNSALVTKSKMLEAKISSENYYREVDELREELAYHRRLLAKMESDGSNDKEKLDKLHHEVDSLDKRLTISWPEYAQQKKNLSITWDQVQQNLEKGEAAIEFVRFYNEDDSIYYYNALVLKKGDNNPTLIKLCKEEELTAIATKMGYSAYYPLIWQPLESALVGIKTIYYAPTGELYNVPFHALYAPKGKGDEVLAAKTDKRGVIIQNERAATEQNAEYLMDRYTMHQLTSTRYLAMGLKQKEKEKIGNNMAMVGGVNYDYLPGTQSAAKKTKKNKNASRSSQSASGKLAYLEGTKTEVEQIASSVTPNNWQATLLENNDATEEKIIKLENKEAKSILHIATHGYAFPEYNFNDTTISRNSLRYAYRYSTNPMVRSGLILAGGNWAWTGSDTLSKLGAEQNGILTALEVSQLNLKKTKLVVLSACETGLGKIEGSEGTFGLKRGFKLAGVEQMIVSLWSVPDKETMELMTLFYSDLTKTLNPVTSFSNAQKEMRNKYPTDPEKWAGFVLVR
jgi:CHAT domain-containing protein/Tfp pilus assembly protein PilF